MPPKTWQEKFEEANRKGGILKETPKGLMYISTPKEIAEIIKKVPKKKLITTAQIIEKLNSSDRSGKINLSTVAKHKREIIDNVNF